MEAPGHREGELIRWPDLAEAIESRIRWWGLFTVTELTVIPAPKLTVVLSCTQLVNWPAMATFRLLVPC